MAAPGFRSFEQALREAAELVDERLNALIPENPNSLIHTAMRYAVLGQGKRLRPFFVLESAKLHGVNLETALDVAVALECVHCYSLVHDDLPAMDDDDVRRGLPTTHRKFDEATAILAGDALLTFAFEVMGLAKVPAPLIVHLAQASGPDGMVGGQMLDIEAESRNFSSLAEISNMQAKKTGALFEFACTAGALLAGADSRALKSYAQYIGIAFQIADDILDVEATSEKLGKATQKDKNKGKATFVDFLGLAPAKQEARDKIAAAIAALDPYGQRADVLRAAAHFIIERQR